MSYTNQFTEIDLTTYLWSLDNITNLSPIFDDDKNELQRLQEMKDSLKMVLDISEHRQEIQQLLSIKLEDVKAHINDQVIHNNIHTIDGGSVTKTYWHYERTNSTIELDSQYYDYDTLFESSQVPTHFSIILIKAIALSKLITEFIMGKDRVKPESLEQQSVYLANLNYYSNLQQIKASYQNHARTASAFMLMPPNGEAWKPFNRYYRLNSKNKINEVDQDVSIDGFKKDYRRMVNDKAELTVDNENKNITDSNYYYNRNSKNFNLNEMFEQETYFGGYDYYKVKLKDDTTIELTTAGITKETFDSTHKELLEEELNRIQTILNSNPDANPTIDTTHYYLTFPEFVIEKINENRLKIMSDYNLLQLNHNFRTDLYDHSESDDITSIFSLFMSSLLKQFPVFCDYRVLQLCGVGYNTPEEMNDDSKVFFHFTANPFETPFPFLQYLMYVLEKKAFLSTQTICNLLFDKNIINISAKDVIKYNFNDALEYSFTSKTISVTNEDTIMQNSLRFLINYWSQCASFNSQSMNRIFALNENFHIMEDIWKLDSNKQGVIDVANLNIHQYPKFYISFVHRSNDRDFPTRDFMNSLSDIVNQDSNMTERMKQLQENLDVWFHANYRVSKPLDLNFVGNQISGSIFLNSLELTELIYPLEEYLNDASASFRNIIYGFSANKTETPDLETQQNVEQTHKPKELDLSSDVRKPVVRKELNISDKSPFEVLKEKRLLDNPTPKKDRAAFGPQRVRNGRQFTSIKAASSEIRQVTKPSPPTSPGKGAAFQGKKVIVKDWLEAPSRMERVNRIRSAAKGDTIVKVSRQSLSTTIQRRASNIEFVAKSKAKIDTSGSSRTQPSGTSVTRKVSSLNAKINFINLTFSRIRNFFTQNATALVGIAAIALGLSQFGLNMYMILDGPTFAKARNASLTNIEKNNEKKSLGLQILIFAMGGFDGYFISMRPSFNSFAELNGNPDTASQVFLMIADTAFDMLVSTAISSITAIALGSRIGIIGALIGGVFALTMLIINIIEIEKQKLKYKQGKYDWQGDNLLVNEAFYYDALEMSNMCDGMMKVIHIATNETLNMFEYVSSMETVPTFSEYAVQSENVSQSRYHPKLLEGMIHTNLKLTNGIHNFVFTQSIPKSNYPSQESDEFALITGMNFKLTDFLNKYSGYNFFTKIPAFLIPINVNQLISVISYDSLRIQYILLNNTQDNLNTLLDDFERQDISQEVIDAKNQLNGAIQNIQININQIIKILNKNRTPTFNISPSSTRFYSNSLSGKSNQISDRQLINRWGYNYLYNNGYPQNVSARDNYMNDYDIFFFTKRIQLDDTYYEANKDENTLVNQIKIHTRESEEIINIDPEHIPDFKPISISKEDLNALSNPNSDIIISNQSRVEINKALLNKQMFDDYLYLVETQSVVKPNPIHLLDDKITKDYIQQSYNYTTLNQFKEIGYQPTSIYNNFPLIKVLASYNPSEILTLFVIRLDKVYPMSSNLDLISQYQYYFDFYHINLGYPKQYLAHKILGNDSTTQVYLPTTRWELYNHSNFGRRRRRVVQLANYTFGSNILQNLESSMGNLNDAKQIVFEYFTGTKIRGGNYLHDYEQNELSSLKLHPFRYLVHSDNYGEIEQPFNLQELIKFYKDIHGDSHILTVENCMLHFQFDYQQIISTFHNWNDIIFVLHEPNVLLNETFYPLRVDLEEWIHKAQEPLENEFVSRNNFSDASNYQKFYGQTQIYPIVSYRQNSLALANQPTVREYYLEHLQNQFPTYEIIQFVDSGQISINYLFLLKPDIRIQDFIQDADGNETFAFRDMILDCVYIEEEFKSYSNYPQDFTIASALYNTNFTIKEIIDFTINNLYYQDKNQFIFQCLQYISYTKTSFDPNVIEYYNPMNQEIFRYSLRKKQFFKIVMYYYFEMKEQYQSDAEWETKLASFRPHPQPNPYEINTKFRFSYSQLDEITDYLSGSPDEISFLREYFQIGYRQIWNLGKHNVVAFRQAGISFSKFCYHLAFDQSMNLLDDTTKELIQDLGIDYEDEYTVWYTNQTIPSKYNTSQYTEKILNLKGTSRYKKTGNDGVYTDHQSNFPPMFQLFNGSNNSDITNIERLGFTKKDFIDAAEIFTMEYVSNSYNSYFYNIFMNENIPN